MFPIALDLSRIPVLLVGQGELLQKRLAQLKEAGACNITVIDGGEPGADMITQNNIVMVAGLERAQSEKVASAARAAGKLVNVEDVNDLCDFYFTANIRRGDLLIAVSTGGASPTLARRVRDKIAELFGEEWGARVSELSVLRKDWKASGKSMQDVMRATDAHLKKKGWL